MPGSVGNARNFAARPALALIEGQGSAHGTELGTNGVLTFGLGFLMATAVLHGTGLALARRMLMTGSGATLLRGVGIATIAAGAIMAGMAG